MTGFSDELEAIKAAIPRPQSPAEYGMIAAAIAAAIIGSGVEAPFNSLERAAGLGRIRREPRSKYMPHIGAKQRAKGLKRLQAATPFGLRYPAPEADDPTTSTD